MAASAPPRPRRWSAAEPARTAEPPKRERPVARQPEPPAADRCRAARRLPAQKFPAAGERPAGRRWLPADWRAQRVLQAAWARRDARTRAAQRWPAARAD